MNLKSRVDPEHESPTDVVSCSVSQPARLQNLAPQSDFHCMSKTPRKEGKAGQSRSLACCSIARGIAVSVTSTMVPATVEA